MMITTFFLLFLINFQTKIYKLQIIFITYILVTSSLRYYSNIDSIKNMSLLVILLIPIKSRATI